MKVSSSTSQWLDLTGESMTHTREEFIQFGQKTKAGMGYFCTARSKEGPVSYLSLFLFARRFAVFGSPFSSCSSLSSSGSSSELFMARAGDAEDIEGEDNEEDDDEDAEVE